jgi:hypothetical protein
MLSAKGSGGSAPEWGDVVGLVAKYQLRLEETTIKLRHTAKLRFTVVVFGGGMARSAGTPRSVAEQLSHIFAHGDPSASSADRLSTGRADLLVLRRRNAGYPQDEPVVPSAMLTER